MNSVVTGFTHLLRVFNGVFQTLSLPETNTLLESVLTGEIPLYTNYLMF